METNLNLNQREQQFFSDFSELLQKNEDMDGKFGLWRVHDHFPLEEDEVFHETSNISKRVSTVKVIKASELPVNSFVSQWRVSKDGTCVPGVWCCD